MQLKTVGEEKDSDNEMNLDEVVLKVPDCKTACLLR